MASGVGRRLQSLKRLANGDLCLRLGSIWSSFGVEAELDPGDQVGLGRDDSGAGKLIAEEGLLKIAHQEKAGEFRNCNTRKLKNYPACSFILLSSCANTKDTPLCSSALEGGVHLAMAPSIRTILASLMHIATASQEGHSRLGRMPPA